MTPVTTTRHPFVYVALLRGINVGGNNMVSMKALKASFEQLGFTDVSTYINSGNLLFRSAEKDARKLERRIDRMLGEAYGLNGRTVVRSHDELARLRTTIAATWQPRPDWRYNVLFLRHTVDRQDILEQLDTRPEIEAVTYCPGALLWCAAVPSLTRTAMVKLAGKPLYQQLTVRNLNTTMKLCDLADRMQHAR